MAVNIHITIIELNALHTKRQNLFQELDAVIHLLMEDRKSGSAGMRRPISYAVFCLKKKKQALIERARPCTEVTVLIELFHVPDVLTNFLDPVLSPYDPLGHQTLAR